jgi:SNF2 family DNA or RNA helicase
MNSLNSQISKDQNGLVPILKPYQRDGIRHLLSMNDGCLFQCPGLGKTLQVLLAYELLRRKNPKLKMLIVAPLRVAQTVWRQEAQKWEPTSGLTVHLIHGRNKGVNLKRKADIHVINYEGLEWLERMMKGRDWPWDIVVWDELTKCKSVGTKRAFWIKRNYRKFGRHWGLTGTPMSTKGYQDLFGQIRTIDGGKALGTQKAVYDQLFFYQASMFDRHLTIKPGADKIITDRISPIVHRLRAEDHLKMPDKVVIHHDIKMTDQHYQRYSLLEDQMAIDVGDHEITAVSAGVLWNKLLQVLQGFSFTDEKDVFWHNEDKIDVLEGIIEEAAGSPVLVFHHFRPEGDRLLKRFPQAELLKREGAEDQVKRWNNNEIEMLCCSPLSAGHGLNLQLGGAHQMVWLCQNGSPEIYQQAVGRLYRQGQQHESVIIHHLNMLHPNGSTVDDDILRMLKDRTTVQDAMLKRLSALQQKRKACAS